MGYSEIDSSRPIFVHVVLTLLAILIVANVVKFGFKFILHYEDIFK